MGIEYRLIIQTDLSLPQVADLILRIPGFEIRHWEDESAIVAPGIVRVSIINESNEGKGIVREALGFEPTVHLTFRISRADLDSIEQGIDNALRAASELSRQCSVRAAFAGESDEVLFKQEDGRLHVNSAHDFWSAEHLALLTLPYELVDLGRIYV